MFFVIGLVFSLTLFVPALAIAFALAQPVYDNVTGFVLLGPVLVGAVVLPTLGMHFGGVIAAGAAISFCVFFLLARNDNPAHPIVQK
ncbi:hypothetical protein [Erythrobacter sp.]|uniref:hypothetical protein n=1 Tax=Erythrobacter sp. TaxID=1042 RepID=UPI001425F9FA|nr:hypothetical protein [Erythrobacter sp.]QIQ86535.1 MAG: hypothetical protein G9473_07425 [Erythrobacter sp.]